MKYQLWTRDEYGTSAILGTFATPAEAVIKGKKLVTEANFNNSLSSSEQIKSIEAYMVEFSGKYASSVYAGLAQNKHSFFKEAGASPIADADKIPVNIYIGSKFVKNKTAGTVNETPFYLKDDKGKPVNSLSHSSIKGKTLYFIRPI